MNLLDAKIKPLKGRREIYMTDCIVKSGVRKAISSYGMVMSKAVPERLEEVVSAILEDARMRAKKNGRKTVMVQDI